MLTELDNSRPVTIKTLTYLGDMQGCGTIRCILPTMIANHYRKYNISYEGYYLSNVIRDIGFYDPFVWVIFQRASSKQHLDIFKFFYDHIRKQTKTALIYEVDDLLYDIADFNYANGFNLLKPYVTEIMSMCDGMTVSTAELRTEYLKYNKNIVVIKNHLAKFIWGEVQSPDLTKKKPSILYAGSGNHFSETDEKGDFGHTILEYINKTSKMYDWIFIGGIPKPLKDNHDIIYHPWCDIFSYPSVLKSIKPTLGVAILEHSHFNQCKSNIKMLEYTCAGIPGVYTDIEPYKDAALKGKTEEELIEHIESLINDQDLRLKTWEHDKMVVASQLYLEDNIEDYINSHLSLFNKRLPLKV